MPEGRCFPMKKKEMIRQGLVGFAGSFFVLYLFYHVVLAGILLSVPTALLYIKYQAKSQERERKWQLTVEFKDAMDSMVSAMAAGYSMENAVVESYQDLCLLYGRETSILAELRDMKEKIRLQVPMDRLFYELGQKSGVEDIITFAQIYATARKSGGNLVKIMKRTAANIGEKIEVQRDIQTMISGKKLEANFMVVIPLMILLYLQIFSPGFLDPLYQGVGRLIMTGALILYAAGVAWSRAIMDIRC